MADNPKTSEHDSAHQQQGKCKLDHNDTLSISHYSSKNEKVCVTELLGETGPLISGEWDWLSSLWQMNLALSYKVECLYVL